MTHYILSIFSCLLLLCSFGTMEANEPDETGTLVVSYQTGPKGERLNRVRFLLINELQQEQMYPKGESYIEDDDKLKRLVAIEDILPGKYIIKFLVPNTDGLFEEVLDKQITIKAGDDLKIDQSIKPRYVSLKAMSTIHPKDKKPAAPPVLTLRDHAGNIAAQSNTGKMIAHYLLPDTYTLVFESIHGFISPTPITFVAHPGKTVGVLTGTYRWVGNTSTPSKEENSETALIAPPAALIPVNPIIIHQVNAQLTVTTNMPQARWTLLKNNQIVYVGQGPVVNYQVPDGDNFRITAEDIEGFSVRINPPYPFSLYPAQTMHAEIIYERTFGTISVEAPFPDGESVVITTSHRRSRTVKSYTVQSKNGKIFWVSPQIPTGDYEISYSLPKDYEPASQQNTYVHPGERIRLKPQLFTSGSLRIQSNIAEAIFIIKSITDGNMWQGEGRDFLFKGLPGGVYQLTFSSTNPDYFIPPNDMQLVLTGKENKDLQVNYQIGGLVIIQSNMDKNAVVIQGLTDKKLIYNDSINEQKKTFTLPEGRYRITLTPLQNTKLSSLKLTPPEPTDIVVKPLSTQTIELPYILEQQAPQNELATLAISTNISAASFTVIRDSKDSNEPAGQYSGKNNKLKLLPGQYQIVFSNIANYKTPEPINITLEKGKTASAEADYHLAQDMVDVPTGPAIIGKATAIKEISGNNAAVITISAFSIGTYEVTNAQMASWLNEALKKDTIVYVTEADNQGQVLDTQGRLLCKTFAADPYSQITTQRHQHDIIAFTVLPGKEQFPVINVSWYGAMAYCADNGFRLPTESEWEKAAGMAPEGHTGLLKKYIYGFGRDEIDPSWANYKATDRPIQHFQVLTTPVGFYNGANPLPLTSGNARQVKTSLAKSPYGAFDMSGNVWEWVADWFTDNYVEALNSVDPNGPQSGTNKVVKGGCYDSLADGVRVTERIGLKPDHTDAFTGFRVAK